MTPEELAEQFPIDAEVVVAKNIYPTSAPKGTRGTVVYHELGMVGVKMSTGPGVGVIWPFNADEVRPA